MAEELRWNYKKFDEEGKVKTVDNYTNDTTGKITGHIVMNVKAWFDENPAERIRLGWIKNITHSRKEIEYNKQTQFLVTSQKWLDEYTTEEVIHVMDKSEEMIEFEEMLNILEGGGITFIGDDF